MCESTYVPRSARAAIPRPRWGRLYGVVLLGVAWLTVADIAAPAVARPRLETVAILVTFVAVALWARGNRAALDQQAWCDCAADTVTVRVVVGHRSDSDGEPAWCGNGDVAEGRPGSSVIEEERPARVLQHAGRD
jgi:hypothetical protein